MEGCSLGWGWGIGVNINKNGEGTTYGAPVNSNPNLFCPDPECCTKEEMAKHEVACQEWDKNHNPHINSELAKNSQPGYAG